MKQGTLRSFRRIGFFVILIGTFLAGEVPAASGEQRAPIRLTKGRDIPVCQAYLQRLKNAPFDYDHPPYCDRPEDDSVPGFAKLMRTPLSPVEVNKLYPLAFNFELPPQTYETDGLKRIRRGQLDVTLNVGHGLEVWSYKPAIDIFNNGVPVNLLMWRGVGLGAGPQGSCGVNLSGADGATVRSDQLPLVFKSGDGAIDESATKLLPPK